jgi:sporulation protein YlmC with PRC-barrel domain
VPLNRIIIDFHKNNGCLFRKINTKEGQVIGTVGDLYIKFDKPLEGILLNKSISSRSYTFKVNDENFVSRA